MRLSDIAAVLTIIVAIIAISTFLAGLWSLPGQEPTPPEPVPPEPEPPEPVPPEPESSEPEPPEPEPPDKPVIKYFKASPSEIKPDESATLSWSVSDASNVNIDPGIGNMGLTDTKVVSPTKTTTYTLTATNDAGSIDATVEVLVGTTPLLPELFVSEFSLDPSTPLQGSPVSVRIGVYNKGTDRSEAFTVQWWAGENFTAPACTWRVDSLAARGGRILTCTYDGYRSWYGRLTTKVVVDSAEEVAESNEGNNVDRMTISVSPKS